jgi:predicted nucleic acid-binding protein
VRDLLIDADAFRFLRALGLLDEVFSALRPDRRVLLTEYIARHELSVLSRDLDRLVSEGFVQVERVGIKTPAGRRYREFQREADKGEAEAIAWALDAPSPSRPVFVSRDAGARRFAAAQGVASTDVMGVVVEAVLTGRLLRTRAEEASLSRCIGGDPLLRQGNAVNATS